MRVPSGSKGNMFLSACGKLFPEACRPGQPLRKPGHHWQLRGWRTVQLQKVSLKAAPLAHSCKTCPHAPQAIRGPAWSLATQDKCTRAEDTGAGSWVRPTEVLPTGLRKPALKLLTSVKGTASRRSLLRTTQRNELIYLLALGNTLAWAVGSTKQQPARWKRISEERI